MYQIRQEPPSSLATQEKPMVQWLVFIAAAQAVMGHVEITVVDKATGKPVPCRVHLKDTKGKALKADPLPFWNDHFVCRGEVALDLSPGKYTVEIEHGPEYSLF